MANEEHLAVLKKDVSAWNDWRRENSSVIPDLAGADVMATVLRNAVPTRGRTNLIVSNFFGDDVRGAIGAAEEAIGFFVACDLLLGRIEMQSAAEAVGSVGQVDESCGDVGFLDGRMNILGAAATDAIDEVGVVVAGSFTVGAWFEFTGEPSFVGVVAVDGEITV